MHGRCCVRIVSCTGSCRTSWRRPGRGSGSGPCSQCGGPRAGGYRLAVAEPLVTSPISCIGDLTPQNVIVSRLHGLVPIDFQDTVRRFEVPTTRPSPTPRSRPSSPVAPDASTAVTARAALRSAPALPPRTRQPAYHEAAAAPLGPARDHATNHAPLVAAREVGHCWDGRLLRLILWATEFLSGFPPSAEPG